MTSGLTQQHTQNSIILEGLPLGLYHGIFLLRLQVKIMKFIGRVLSWELLFRFHCCYGFKKERLEMEMFLKYGGCVHN